MLSTLSALLLVSTLFMVLSGKITTLVRWLAIQAFLLAGIAFGIGNLENVKHLYGAALLIICIKAIGVPGVFSLFLHKRELELVEVPLLSRGLSLGVALGLMVVGYYVVPPEFANARLESNSLLAVSISMALIGCFIMISRKRGLAQLAGLLTMENGLSLAAMLLTRGMPVVVEAGIYVDILIGVIVMILFSQRMAAMRKGQS